jgi:hypothetical protein
MKDSPHFLKEEARGRRVLFVDPTPLSPGITPRRVAGI